ncbi:ATP-binding protein [Streptomyces sp. NPDC090108]|uniref:ATP-binding protein n=1 Tax=Streptomyces sp. NPDC090108 TaxID=3365947 RepID=UPI0038097FB0
MDPIMPGPEERDQVPSRRPPRESLTSEFGQSAPVRTARLVSGDLLLTVNPVDGSEIELCPPGRRPAPPRRRTAAERAETALAARPAAPAGPSEPALPLLEREDEREQLVRLLARGRSVRLTGPGGSGRTALLDLVAEDCGDLAPDGVVRLTGYHRTAVELLRDLFHAVYDAQEFRPEEEQLLELVRTVGAVVVVDDAELGGAALDELLDATPECAFLLGATPDVPAPSAASEVEEVVLGGLDRAGGVEILERAVGRTLTEEEANWAGDLWFESEGLPLRFVQAGALLRQRDQLRASTGAVDEYGVFEDVRPAADPAFDAAFEPAFDADGGEEIPLPSLGEAAGPAPLLAARLSASARDTLRFAVALGGEVPHQAHLPALVGDTHADAALGELAACGLVSPVGARYRLAAGVPAQLEAAGYDSDRAERALTAAQHYTWWAGHPSVTPERVCAEADAVLAALAVVVPDTTAPAEDEDAPAVQLARTAAPAFAAGLQWGAWERALRSGAEASRLSGEPAEQAYFHHELGVLALCGGQLDRARAELETSNGLRGALADKRGTVAGRRALALVADRSGDVPGAVAMAALAAMAAEEVPETRHEEPAPPRGGTPASYGPLYGSADVTLVSSQSPASETRGGIGRVARRNLVAVGSGALLAAVLGTVVTLGMTSNENADKNPAGSVEVDPSATQGLDDGNLGAAPKRDDSGSGDTGTATSRPTGPGSDGTEGAATPSGSGDPSGTGTASASGKPSDATPKPSKSTKPSGSTSGGTGGGAGGGTGGTTGGTTGSPTGGTTTGGAGGSTTGTTGSPTGGATDGGSTDGATGDPTGGATDGGTGTTTDGGTGTTTGADGGTTAPSAAGSATASQTPESASPSETEEIV